MQSCMDCWRAEISFYTLCNPEPLKAQENSTALEFEIGWVRRDSSIESLRKRQALCSALARGATHRPGPKKVMNHELETRKTMAPDREARTREKRSCLEPILAVRGVHLLSKRGATLLRI